MLGGGHIFPVVMEILLLNPLTPSRDWEETDF